MSHYYLNQWWLVYRRIYASLGLNELTHSEVKTKWLPFSSSFPFWKLLNSKWNSTEICSYGSYWQYGGIGWDSGLASNMRQSIIWNNIGMYYWHICITWPQWVNIKNGTLSFGRLNLWVACDAPKLSHSVTLDKIYNHKQWYYCHIINYAKGELLWYHADWLFWHHFWGCWQWNYWWGRFCMAIHHPWVYITIYCFMFMVE